MNKTIERLVDEIEKKLDEAYEEDIEIAMPAIKIDTVTFESLKADSVLVSDRLPDEGHEHGTVFILYEKNNEHFATQGVYCNVYKGWYDGDLLGDEAPIDGNVIAWYSLRERHYQQHLKRFVTMKAEGKFEDDGSAYLARINKMFDK